MAFPTRSRLFGRNAVLIGGLLGVAFLTGCSGAADSPAAEGPADRGPSTTASKTHSVAPETEAAPSATSADLGDPEPPAPADLVSRLQAGGLVIVFRYTGATTSADTSRPPLPPDGAVDDGQRISDDSKRKMTELGQHYRELSIPVGSVLSSQYFFVSQHLSLDEFMALQD